MRREGPAAGWGRPCWKELGVSWRVPLAIRPRLVASCEAAEQKGNGDAEASSASSPAPAGIGVGRSPPLPQIWAVSSPDSGCSPSVFHPTPWGSSSPTQDISLDPEHPLPAWELAEPPNAAQQPGCPTRGSPAPRDPSLLPRGGIWGAGCSHGAGHVPAESPGALCSGEQSPSPTRRLFTGI